VDLSTQLCQVSTEGYLEATSGPNPQLHPLRVDPTHPFPPPGLGGGVVLEVGHTPETLAASSDMPQHHPTCMTGRCDALVALLPPAPLGPPSRLTLERLTMRSSPLTFHGRASNSGPLHPVVSGQHRGTPGSIIRENPQLHPLRVDPTRPFPPPGAGGGAIREGGHSPETRAGRLQPPQHTQTCEKPCTQDCWHPSPWRPPATVVDM
jgi:hypothetical protein